MGDSVVFARVSGPVSRRRMDGSGELCDKRCPTYEPAVPAMIVMNSRLSYAAEIGL